MALSHQIRFYDLSISDGEPRLGMTGSKGTGTFQNVKQITGYAGNLQGTIHGNFVGPWLAFHGLLNALAQKFLQLS